MRTDYLGGEVENNKKIKILQLVDGFRLGGAELKLLELVEHLDKKKYEIIICSLMSDGPLKKKFEDLGFPVIVFSRKNRFDITLFFKLYNLLKKKKINIVQTTLFYADFIGSLVAKLANIPVVISWETVSHEAGNSFHAKLVRQLGYRLAMKYVDCIISVSDQVRNSIIKWRKIKPSKIRTVRYGVNLSKYTKSDSFAKRDEIGSAKHGPILGVVARLEEVKGHLYLVDAVAQIKDNYPELNCLLIGDGSYRKPIYQKIQELGVVENFTFLGFRNDIPELINLLDIFILPSIYEGLPNALLEAMACSKPVIATKVGGIHEVVIDGINGLLVPPRDPNALASAILKLLNNESLMKELGKKGRKSVENEFSMHNQIHQFEKTYDFYLKKVK